jgi:hypothetical protein
MTQHCAGTTSLLFPPEAFEFCLPTRATAIDLDVTLGDENRLPLKTGDASKGRLSR